MKPLISILLPTHNRADVLPYAIESVLYQTVQDFELLIVGDGCTDDTESVVSSYSSKDSRVHWFSFAKGKGFGYEHRNTVLLTAKGKYGAYIAHDDLWFPDHLEKLLAFLMDNPSISICYSRPLWIHPNGNVLPSTFNTNDHAIKNIFMNDHNEIPAANFMFIQKSAKEVGFWNHKLPAAADWDLWKKIVRKDKNNSIGFISTPTALHFKPNWRKGDEAGMDNVLVDMHREIESDDFLKRVMRIKNKKNSPQQRTVFSLLQKKSLGKSLRDCSQMFLDRRSRLMSPLRTQTGVDSQMLSCLEEIEVLQNNLHRVTSTRGYRFLEKMREIRRSIYRYLP